MKVKLESYRTHVLSSLLERMKELRLNRIARSKPEYW